MFALLGAIALTPQLTHDEKRLEKLQKRMEWARRRREGPQYQPGACLLSARHEPLTIIYLYGISCRKYAGKAGLRALGKLRS